jgi:3-methyladenine DNA glycosylase Tag
MSINKITVKERIIIRHQDKLDEIKEVEKVYKREDYEGDFDNFILENITNYHIEDYAENVLDMVDTDDCECDNNLHNVDSCSLISELRNRGFETIKCQTLTDSFKLEQVKELMQIQ